MLSRRVDRAVFSLRTANGGTEPMPMLRLADYVREDLVLWDLPFLDKPTLIRALAAEVAARLPDVDAEALGAQLLEREEQQSTGVGGGLALPHAMLPGLEKTVSAQDAHTEHLRVLARLVRIIAPEETLEKLRSATGPAELFQMLLEEDARHVY
jgi:PTS system nitrogen regulatory IIA component